MLSATDLWKRYPIRSASGQVTALAGVTLDVAKGETLGVVGESGCGKTTLARLLLRLEEPTSGKVELDGVDITSLRGHELRAIRRRIHTTGDVPAHPGEAQESKASESRASSLFGSNHHALYGSSAGRSLSKRI